LELLQDDSAQMSVCTESRKSRKGEGKEQC